MENKQKSQLIQIRVNPKLKDKVETILEELGISTSQAINMFFKQVEREKGIPFSLKLEEEIPMVSPELEKSMIESRKDYENGNYYTIDAKNEEELDEQLNKMLSL